ncbi:MAG: copper amine oxidase N-terminal domain-containing protein, partial [Defluviitaleaceae bacterium]|nr:copper amine oxidase N-terminal domain-containing protein [Defluviitaleaceae bacterium]
VTDNPFTLNEVSAVTHLIFDVAGRPAGNMNIVLAGGHTGGWNQDDLSVAAGFCQETMRIIIDLRNHTAYALWNDVSDGGARRVIVSHNSESWDEMNVIRAFFVLDDSYVPPPPGCGDCDEPDCEYCNPPEITTEVIWTLEVTQEMVDTLNANETYDRVTPADSPTFTYVNGNLQVSGRAENWFSLDVLLRDMELTEDGSYRITAVGTAAPGALFMAEKPLENEPWNVGRITGNATGVIKYFTSVIPRVGTVTPGYDEDGLCLHRIRIFTTGTGNFTVSSIIVERMLGVVVPPPDVCEECGDDPCTCPPDDYTPAPTPPPTLQPAPRPPAGGGFAPVVRPAAPGAITPPAAPPAQPPAAAVSVDYEGVEVVIPDNVMAYLFPNVADLANMQVRITQTPGAFGTDYDTTGVLTTVDVAIYLHDTPITRRLPSPVAVAVSLEGFDLAGVNVHRIVALDESGEVIGGHVCTDTNRFIFATALTGAFEITYVQELRRLVVGLDTNIIRDLADNAPLQTMDVLPVIENGRTLLPVRFLANALGAEIGWNEAAREVTLTKDGQSLTIPIGVITPELAALGLDVPPMIVDGRTMMPTRFIANYFGALIEWDDATRTFEIIM